MFSQSSIGMTCCRDEWTEPVVHFAGGTIRPYLIGDSGYTLAPNMMVPYPGHHLTQRQKPWPLAHWHSTRIIVEQACGRDRLKGRFRWFSGRMAIRSPLDYARAIWAGCILHDLLMDIKHCFSCSMD